MRGKPLFFFVSAALCLPLSIKAGPLTEAHVTKIINDVKIVDPAAGERRARLQDAIRDQIALTTGIKSRSELLFGDNTLTRIGPESYFSFKSGTRDMTLEKGTLLLQVPKGLGGAKIHTAAVTAAITGTTVMMEYVPKKHIKVVVLEGSLRLSVNGRFGDPLLLPPGKMVIMRPDAKRIPDPVTVDLKHLVQTSTLVNMHHGKKIKAAPLPSLPLIDKEVAQQEKDKKGHSLISTNLVIVGKGTNVTLGSEELMQNLAKRVDVEKQQHLPTVVRLPPGPPGLADIGPAPTIKQDGKDKDQRTQVRYGSDAHPVLTPIVLNAPQDWTHGGGTGSIKIESNDAITVNTTLKVSDVNSGHHDGEISIDSRKTTGTAIAISSSAQLLALLNAASGGGGHITFRSAGGDVNVDGGTVQADHGTVEIRNDGASGVINLTNATLNASTVKVGALGNNGTLTVGGGTISANSVIKLYAGGSNGTVNFVDDVTLNGNSVKTISGDTVTIFDGKTVTVNGPAPADVFTNHANYTGWGGNASTNGTFAGQGANTHLGSLGPGY
jgi:FecR protein